MPTNLKNTVKSVTIDEFLNGYGVAQEDMEKINKFDSNMEILMPGVGDIHLSYYLSDNEIQKIIKLCKTEIAKKLEVMNIKMIKIQSLL